MDVKNSNGQGETTNSPMPSVESGVKAGSAPVGPISMLEYERQLLEREAASLRALQMQADAAILQAQHYDGWTMSVC